MKGVFRDKVIGAFLGTIVEYYDYGIYGFSANILAAKFFPYHDYLTGLTNIFTIYAVARLSKPLGSLIFGYVGDHYGRKTALSATIIGIVIPTMIIGMLPEYSVIGWWGPLILGICLFMQGIFVAGEYDGAAIYVIEHLGKKFQYTASSITRCTGVIGLLLAICASNFFNSHLFPAWGWRVPFLLSLPLALVVLHYRQKFTETPEFGQAAKTPLKISETIGLIKNHWPAILMVVFLAGGFGATYQIAVIFMKQYLPRVLPHTNAVMSVFSVLIVMFFGASMPISGWIADHTSPVKVVKVSLFCTIIASVLLCLAIRYQMVNLALMSCLALAAFVAPFNALAHGAIIQAFPVRMRYRCISLGHNAGSMLMSGTANYLCITCMKSLNFDLFPVVYLVFSAVLAYFMLKNISCYNLSKQILLPKISPAK